MPALTGLLAELLTGQLAGLLTGQPLVLLARQPLGVRPALDVPVDLTREEARRLAELELADPAYRAGQPSVLQRVVDWLVEQVQRVLDAVSNRSPGGWLGIIGLVTLVVVAALFLRWRLGPVAGTATITFTIDPGTTAAQYRTRAEELAGSGHWDQAVSERMRALVRRAQERGLIDSQPGWTADEVAAAVSTPLPDAHGTLLAAARAFDDVRYGGRSADRGSYATVASADDLVERAQAASIPGVDR